MKKMKLIAVISFIAVILFATWQSYKNRGKAQTDIAVRTEQYEATTATIASVFELRRNYRRSTLMHISYNQGDQQRKATLHRQGYRKGAYNKGDTITIFVINFLAYGKI